MGKEIGRSYERIVGLVLAINSAFDNVWILLLSIVPGIGSIVYAYRVLAGAVLAILVVRLIVGFQNAFVAGDVTADSLSTQP